MARKLELWYPAKPYVVTQAWGIFNLAYRQFGFEKHNGIDFAVDKDCVVVAMCDGIVTDIGINDGAGIYVKYRTLDLVNAEGTDCFVQFFYMHGKQLLVKKNDIVKVGTPLMVADNTGFSTGAHTHISAYRLSPDGNTRLDTDPATNNTFDFSKYYNGYFADDYEYLTSPRFKWEDVARFINRFFGREILKQKGIL